MPHPIFARVLGTTRDAPAVVAHRGKSDTHPENTLPAFDAAVDAGAEVIEFDVRQSRDGHWVCIHDATTQRTARGEGEGSPRGQQSVAERSWDDLAQLDVGSWKGEAFAGTPPPDLEAALESIHRGSIAMIEHKAGKAADMARELQRLGVVDRVIVQSFDWSFLREIHDLVPSLAIGALGPTRDHPSLDAATIATAQTFGAGMIHWRATNLELQAAELVRAADLVLCTYTTDNEMSWLGQAVAGVHLITTNRPQQLRTLIDRGGLARVAGSK